MKLKPLKQRRIMGAKSLILFKQKYVFEVLTEVGESNECNSTFISLSNARKFLKISGYKYMQGKDISVETFVKENPNEGNAFFKDFKKKSIAYLKAVAIYA